MFNLFRHLTGQKETPERTALLGASRDDDPDKSFGFDALDGSDLDSSGHFAIVNPVTDIESNQHSIAVVTYNVGNNNLHKKAIKSLRKKIFPVNADRPDLIFFMLQESKNSIVSNQPIPERIIKNRPGFHEELPYEILHDHNVTIWTHPENPLNHPDYGLPAKMKLTIAYNPDAFIGRNIFIKHQGTCVSENREKKGGLFAVLCIDGINIAVVCIHLDSRNQNTAKQQLSDLITKCETECIEKGICLDDMIIAGDFNIRLHPEGLNPEFVSKKTARVESLSPISNRPRAITVTNEKWQKDVRYPRLQELKLYPPEDLTYSKGKTLTQNPGRNNNYDFGALDLIATKNYNQFNFSDVKFKTPIAADIYVPSIFSCNFQKQASDHKPVIGQAVLTKQLTPTEKETRANNENSIFNYKERMAQNHYNPAQPSVFHAFFDQEGKLQNTAFIIDRLHTLSGKKININDLIAITFGTSEQIEATLENTGEFMLARYNQLLSEKINCDGKLKLMLLKPFREWLDEHRIRRAHYYYRDEQNSHSFTIKHGFFAPNLPEGTHIVNEMKICQR